MSRWRFFVIFAVLTGWWWLGHKINYPPTEEQLLIGLWPVFWTRLFCFVLIVCSFWFWKKIFSKYKLRSLYFYFVLVMCLSPTVFGWFWLHPIESLKWFLVSGIFWLSCRWKWLGLFFPIVFLLLFSLIQNTGKAKIWENFESKRAVFEVTQKFGREDSLIEKIELPLWLRRASYNKYSWMLSSTFKEFISFWDFEAWFFQEIHPSGKKALIMFYWPEFVLVIIGIYSLIKKKDDNYYRLVGSLLLLAISGYLFSNQGESLRFSLVLPLVSLLVAEALFFLTKYKIYLYVFWVFLFYGFQVFLADLGRRPDYWLDNRPITYQYFFEITKNIPGKIQVTDRVANAALYCRYFLGNGCSDRFSLAGFDFKKSLPIRNITYAGFEGEFYGPNFDNIFPEKIDNLLMERGFDIISKKSLRDNIANLYGKVIFVAKLK